MTLGFVLAGIGLALMVGLAGCGSAFGTSSAGSAAVGALKKKPEGFGSYMVLAALPATQGLYSLARLFRLLRCLIGRR